MQKLLIAVIVLAVAVLGFDAYLFLNKNNTKVVTPIVQQQNQNLNNNIVVDNTNPNGCSVDNPPSLVPVVENNGQDGYLQLNLCGKVTGYHAWDISDSGIILYQKPTDNSVYNFDLRTIQTISPFEDESLSMTYYPFSAKLKYDQSSGIFYDDQFASGPGNLDSVFSFRPKTRDFVYILSKTAAGSSDNSNVLAIESSRNKNAKFFYKESVTSVGTEDDPFKYEINGITYNNQIFNKDDINSGRADGVMKMFRCDSLDYHDVYPGGQNMWGVNDKTFFNIDNFPPKIVECSGVPSLDSTTGEYIGKKGFFDFDTGKFVITGTAQ